jgi:uncharacterized membrane protein
MTDDAKQFLVNTALVVAFFGFFWWAISPPALPTAWIFGVVAVGGTAIGYYLFGDSPRAPGGR